MEWQDNKCRRVGDVDVKGRTELAHTPRVAFLGAKGKPNTGEVRFTLCRNSHCHLRPGCKQDTRSTIQVNGGKGERRHPQHIHMTSPGTHARTHARLIPGWGADRPGASAAGATLRDALVLSLSSSAFSPLTAGAGRRVHAAHTQMPRQEAQV